MGLQEDVCRNVIEQHAARRKAPVAFLGQDFTAWEEGGRLIYQDEQGLLELAPSKLPGVHQTANAGLALAALRAAGLLDDTAAIAACDKALRCINWPARLQPLYEGKLIEQLPANSEVWVDGGHNPGAAKVIANFLADLSEKSSRPTILVAGMMQTKDPTGFFAEFEGLVQEVICVPLTTTPMGRTPDTLCEIVQESGLKASSVRNLEEAVSSIRERYNQLQEPLRVMFSGSLYLAGEVLDKNQTPPQ